MNEQQTPTNADQEILKTWLKDRDAFCPACGYNLRNLLSDYCPECGRRVFLRVGAEQTGVGLFIALIAPLLFVGGFGCLLSLFAIGEGMPPFATHWYMWLIILGCPSELLLAIILVMLRRRYFRMRRASQKLYVMISWGVNIVVFLLFFSFVIG